MKVTLIEYPVMQDWLKVKQRALVTMGKTKVINAPTLEWKNNIRFLRISYFVEDLPYWVSNELCRHHEGIEKFVKSQRNDRQTEYDRNSARQDSPVNLIVDFNAEGLISFCNKRLCGKASKEMQELADEFRKLLEKECPEFKGVLVPMCVHCGGVCHEIEPCTKN